MAPSISIKIAFVFIMFLVGAVPDLAQIIESVGLKKNQHQTGRGPNFKLLTMATNFGWYMKKFLDFNILK